MKNITIENIFIEFLIAPRYKYLRHLGLIITCLIMCTNIFIHQPDSSTTSPKVMIIGTLGYFLPLIIIIYINSKIGINRYLIHNRLGAYFLFLSTLIVIYISVLFLLIFHFLDFEAIWDADVKLLILNFSSSFFLILLILIGINGLFLYRYWIISSLKAETLKSENLKSELNYLSSQINPHFLFNMLNNVHVLLKEKKGKATPILQKLEDLLDYQIKIGNKEKTLLSSDIHFLEDYLNLEKIRRDNFEFEIRVEGNTNLLSVPPLLFIPFIENAVKHSQDSDNPSFIKAEFIISETHIRFICVNSKPDNLSIESTIGGLGLKNIQRRLELIYGKRYELKMHETDRDYSVTLVIPLIIQN